MPLVKRLTAPLLLGRAPVLHRTSVNAGGNHGAFRRTRPIGGASPVDAPYPYVKVAYEPEPSSTWAANTKILVLVYFLCWLFGIGKPFIMPDDNVVAWAENEMLRRRRERRERQEMDILGIDEDDVDPKLVRELDQLYVKGRTCFV